MIYENIIKLLKFRVNKVNKLFFGKIYVKVHKRGNLRFTLASCSLICYQLRKLQFKKLLPIVIFSDCRSLLKRSRLFPADKLFDSER